jgi:hypothetical protein
MIQGLAGDMTELEEDPHDYPGLYDQKVAT